MKQQKELLVLVVLLVIAGNIWYWFFFRQKPIASSGTVAVAQNYRLLSVENPAPHTDRREAARKTEYKSNGRNPFSPIAAPPTSQVPAPVVPQRERSGPPVESLPPPPEIPPNMHFFGYGMGKQQPSPAAFAGSGGED